MRVAVDAFQAAPQITGTDRQARNALDWLQRLDRENEYHVIVHHQRHEVARGIRAENFRLVPLEIERRVAWTVLRLPLLLRRLRADVFFSFHNLSGPVVRTCPVVLSALDLVPFAEQATYFRSTAHRLAVLAAMRAAVRRAEVLLANSEFTRQAVIAYFGLDPGRVLAAPLQADPVFFVDPGSARRAACRRRYELPEHFVLAMGGSEPRKNVARLVQAHRSLSPALRAAYPLLVAGAPWQGRELDTGGGTEVRSLGYVADEDLPALYRMATVFAFPSLHEGFGLPVLEAMASGTPVLTSSATSLPSVAGEAALIVDPTDVAALARGLERLLTDRETRERLVRAGRRQLERFSWKRNAEGILEALHQAVARGSRGAPDLRRASS